MAYLIKSSKEREVKILEGRIEYYRADYIQTARFFHNGSGWSEVDKYPLRWCKGSIWVETKDDILKGLELMKEHYDKVVSNYERSLISAKTSCVNIDKAIKELK